jgi:hypothetical protein
MLLDHTSGSPYVHIEDVEVTLGQVLYARR